MERQSTLYRILALVLVGVVLTILLSPALAYADWQKMDPPDADKPGDTSRSETCWQAAAANMLAGAGYGNGDTVQERAQDIYDELFSHFGNQRGWTDTALNWWLNSAHNEWKGSYRSYPYTDVTFRGAGIKTAYQDPDLPKFIGNELRGYEMVSLGIGDPACKWWHEITVWGDSGDAAELTTNPAQVIVADSDLDTGGDVQTYNYEPYNNGWKISYNDTPYITDFTTLCPTDPPMDFIPSYPYPITQKVVGSYRIKQDRLVPPTDLHYIVGTGFVDILSYHTTIDWPLAILPTIMEGSPRRNLTVDWDFPPNFVPLFDYVTITTEFVLAEWFPFMSYNDVYFTYPDAGLRFPAFAWAIDTPELDDTNLPNIRGGYVVGSFDLFAEGMDEPLQYRFLHEYDYFQDPEEHYFSLMATEEQVVEPYNIYAANLRFGHSYGFLDTDSLWEFEEWITYDDEYWPLDPDSPIDVTLDWDDLLPYPAGVGPPPPTTGTGDDEQEQPCGYVTPVDAAPLALVSVAILAVWATKRRGRGPGCR